MTTFKPELIDGADKIYHVTTRNHVSQMHELAHAEQAHKLIQKHKLIYFYQVWSVVKLSIQEFKHLSHLNKQESIQAQLRNFRIQKKTQLKLDMEEHLQQQLQLDFASGGDDITSGINQAQLPPPTYEQMAAYFQQYQSAAGQQLPQLFNQGGLVPKQFQTQQPLQTAAIVPGNNTQELPKPFPQIDQVYSSLPIAQQNVPSNAIQEPPQTAAQAKTTKKAKRGSKRNTRKQVGRKGQPSNLCVNSDLIQQINTLNLEANSRPRQPRQKKEKMQIDLQNVRKNPDRCGTKDKINYNEVKLIEQNKNQQRLSRESQEEKQRKPVQEEEKMEVDYDDQIDPQNPYEKIIINANGIDEDIQCDICLEFEHEDEDQIIMCDLCNAATHQSCYGGELINGIPQGNWYCQRCQALLGNRNLKCTEIKCFLCPDIDGLMKCVDYESDLWAHLICVNWNSDIYFTDDLKNKISGTLNKKRFELLCNLCHQTAKGACLQCDYKTCGRSYHVRCAVRRDMIKDMDEYDELMEGAEDPYYIPIFCEKHDKQGWKEFQAKDKKRNIFLAMHSPQNKKEAAKTKKSQSLKANTKHSSKKIADSNLIDVSRSPKLKEVKEVIQKIAESKTNKKSLVLVDKKSKGIKKVVPKTVASKVTKKPILKNKKQALRGKTLRSNTSIKKTPVKKVLSPKKKLEPTPTLVQKPKTTQMPTRNILKQNVSSPFNTNMDMNFMMTMMTQMMQSMVAAKGQTMPPPFIPIPQMNPESPKGKIANKKKKIVGRR